MEAALAANPVHRPTAAEFARQLGAIAKRGRVLSGKTATIIMLLAILVWLAVSPVINLARRSPDRTLVLSVPDLMVVRENEVVNLKTVLPLRAGDRVSMTFLVAPREEVVAVWLDADGKARVLNTIRTPSEEVDRIRYPDSERPVLISGPEGTDMIFVCRGTPIDEQTLLACFPTQPPPAIPDQVYIQLQRLSRIESMGPVPPHSHAAEQVAQVESYMKDIDERLRRHFEGVRGIAFPHRGALQEVPSSDPE